MATELELAEVSAESAAALPAIFRDVWRQYAERASKDDAKSMRDFAVAQAAGRAAVAHLTALLKFGSLLAGAGAAPVPESIEELRAEALANLALPEP